MAYYRKCPLCGANLDPGEFCECQENEHGPESHCEENRVMLEDTSEIIRFQELEERREGGFYGNCSKYL